MEMSSPLVQLALLESLKTNTISDEIDLFLPFIAVTLADLGKLEVSAELLQEELTRSFGFRPPLSAVQVFMTRARKRKLLHKENRVFIPNMEEVEKWQNGYHSKKDDITASLELLRRDFKSFAKERFNKDLEDNECDQLIIQFIEKNVSSVTDHKRFEKNELREKIKNTDHITASFISHIHKANSSSLEHFGCFVKGMLLANYLCYADKVGQKKTYESISVYLDTPIIIGLLGFSGSQREKSIKEFITLLNKVGINVCIFDKSLDECERLLGAWRDDLKKNDYRRFNTKTLELLRHLKYDAERLDSEIKLLSSSIERAGIAMKLGFKAKKQYQCDEYALEAAISPNFKSNKNLEHDTVCISRIFNLREGEHIRDLNQSFSIFVTPNTGLVKLANKHFKDEVPRQTIPLVVSEQWMTAMFWLKSPDMFGTLPMDQVVASAYGLLYTDDKFWTSFIQKLELLEKKGKISENDLIQVRWDSDLLNIVHDVSVDVGEDFSEEDVFDIVESIKRKHIEDKELEIAKLQTESSEKIFQLETVVEEKDNALASTNGRLNKIADFSSTTLASALCITVFACIFWAAYLSLAPQISSELVSEKYQKHAITFAALAVALIMSFGASLFGLNIFMLHKWTKAKIFDSVFRFLKG